jgi:hypothetical protein
MIRIFRKITGYAIRRCIYWDIFQHDLNMNTAFIGFPIFSVLWLRIFYNKRDVDMLLGVNNGN